MIKFDSICPNRAQQYRWRARFVDEETFDARRACASWLAGHANHFTKPESAITRQQLTNSLVGNSGGRSNRGNVTRKRSCWEGDQAGEARQVCVQLLGLAVVRGRAR